MAKFMDELIPTRTTLLHRLKNWQDNPSWQDFFDTYWKLIYSVATKAGLDADEAQDAVQETMITVARQMPSFKYDGSTAGSFKAWLLKTTRWRIADQIRKRRHLPPQYSSDISMADKTVDAAGNFPETLWDTEWAKNLLEAAMDKVKRRLDPEKYQIFDCYVNKEWPPAKIAEAFKIPVSQVYLAKHRVGEMIAEEIKKLEMNTG